jgi:hypothetical protein
MVVHLDAMAVAAKNSASHRAGRLSITLLLAALPSVLAGCGWLAYRGDPKEVVLWGDEFIIAWDASTLPEASENVVRYRLYYRRFPSYGGTWLSLGSTAADDSTVFHVDGSSLRPGKYEFGVRAIDAEGRYSEIHRSTDANADPVTGWYLNWLGGAP